MSPFIGTLAFDHAEQLTAVRLGVLAGSLASGVMGYVTLRWLAGYRNAPVADASRA